MLIDLPKGYMVNPGHITHLRAEWGNFAPGRVPEADRNAWPKMEVWLGGARAIFFSGHDAVAALEAIRGAMATLEPAPASDADAPPPIDPEMPRRFRWPKSDGCGEWNYGCYWPEAWPSARTMPGLEWIDPTPEPAER